MADTNRRKRARFSARTVLAVLAAGELLLLLPLAKDEHLRFAYTQTLARWAAKVRHPQTVFLGDSVMAGGMSFNHLLDINLGSNGLQTYQIAAAIEKANALSPDRIVVMAGTNDAIEGPIDRDEITALWRRMCADKRLIVTLPPPTAVTIFNDRLDQIRGIIVRECRSRPVIAVHGFADSRGRLPADATVDGVHPTRAFYLQWARQLAALGV